MSLTLAFKSQPPLVVATAFALKRFPSVLKRLCGLGEGFAEPNRDSNGHLTFPVQFDISRDVFLKCIAFLRTGILNSEDHIVAMTDVFNTFAGCDEWDAFLQHRESGRVAESKAEATEREQRLQNPLSPADNHLGLFVFEAHQAIWQHSDELQVTSMCEGTTHTFWWRKRE